MKIQEEGSAILAGVKPTLLARIDEIHGQGRIYWEEDAVVDRPIDIGGLAGRVRYIPTFAYRHIAYEGNEVCQCPLCGLDQQPDDTLDLMDDKGSDPDFIEGFNQVFSIHPNNFPFLRGQLLVASREHRKEFTQTQYEQFFAFMGRTGFAGAAMQLEGSGTSISRHAHMSVFDEPLPIFDSEYSGLREADDVTLAASTEHPAACYRISGESIDGKLAQTLTIMGRLRQLGLSYNFYLDSDASAYVIPRTRRHSPSLDLKVGLSLAAGTYNGYAQGSTATDPDILRAEIWENCQTVTADQLLMALRETTVPSEDSAAILKQT